MAKSKAKKKTKKKSVNLPEVFQRMESIISRATNARIKKNEKEEREEEQLENKFRQIAKELFVPVMNDLINQLPAGFNGAYDEEDERESGGVSYTIAGPSVIIDVGISMHDDKEYLYYWINVQSKEDNDWFEVLIQESIEISTKITAEQLKKGITTTLNKMVAKLLKENARRG